MTKDFAAAFMELESDICALARMGQLALVADDADDDEDGRYSLAALSIELFARAAHELDRKWHDLHRGVVGEKQQRPKKAAAAERPTLAIIPDDKPA
jgi:hypothetical protein